MMKQFVGLLFWSVILLFSFSRVVAACGALEVRVTAVLNAFIGKRTNGAIFDTGANSTITNTENYMKNVITDNSYSSWD